MVKYVTFKRLFVAVFFILIAVAVCSVLVLRMPSITITLLLVNFIVAGLIAIFASLRLREEEEEKLFK